MLGLAPLHGLHWSDGNGGRRCLLDRAVVSYSPSAFARLLCLRRAQRPASAGKLVAIGNPLPHKQPLEYAEREARLVADVLPVGETVALMREAATKHSVMDALRGATHVHLACRGSAAIGSRQALDSALALAAGERLSALDVIGLDLVSARLVVASACRSGMIGDLGAADEALALSSVFIGAGAAGVVASLWSVSDYGTALLMARFYEALVREPDEPARALRDAQLWLRDLKPEAESTFLGQQPELREHERAPVARGEGEGRFASPTQWAAFVLAGA